MDETDRLRKRARVLSVVVTVGWALVVVGFGWLTAAVSFAPSADDDRSGAFAVFIAGFATVAAIPPTLLWLIVTVAHQSGRQWAAPTAAAVASVTGMCSMLVLQFTTFADWGGWLTAYVLLLNGLGVAAVIAMFATRTPLPTSSAPQSG